VQHRRALVTALASLLAAEDADTWTQRLLQVGVPAGKVGTIADGFALASDLGLDPLVDVGPGRPAQVRHPIIYSDTPITEYTAPPRLGEHSDAVRRWLQEENRR
jgi:formyl-CoA transferase